MITDSQSLGTAIDPALVARNARTERPVAAASSGPESDRETPASPLLRRASVAAGAPRAEDAPPSLRSMPTPPVPAAGVPASFPPAGSLRPVLPVAGTAASVSSPPVSSRLASDPPARASGGRPRARASLDLRVIIASGVVIAVVIAAFGLGISTGRKQGSAQQPVLSTRVEALLESAAETTLARVPPVEPIPVVTTEPAVSPTLLSPGSVSDASDAGVDAARATGARRKKRPARPPAVMSVPSVPASGDQAAPPVPPAAASVIRSAPL